MKKNIALILSIATIGSAKLLPVLSADAAPFIPGAQAHELQVQTAPEIRLRALAAPELDLELLALLPTLPQGPIMHQM